MYSYLNIDTVKCEGIPILIVFLWRFQHDEIMFPHLDVPQMVDTKRGVRLGNRDFFWDSNFHGVFHHTLKWSIPFIKSNFAFALMKLYHSRLQKYFYRSDTKIKYTLTISCIKSMSGSLSMTLARQVSMHWQRSWHLTDFFGWVLLFNHVTMAASTETSHPECYKIIESVVLHEIEGIMSYLY